MVLAVHWSYMAYIELCSLHTHLGKSLYHIWLLNLLKCFFCIWGNGHMLFILYFLNTTVSIDWSVILKHPCIPGIYLTWSYLYDLIIYWRIYFASILWRIFASMINQAYRFLFCAVFVWFWYKRSLKSSLDPHFSGIVWEVLALTH